MVYWFYCMALFHSQTRHHMINIVNWLNGLTVDLEYFVGFPCHKSPWNSSTSFSPIFCLTVAIIVRFYNFLPAIYGMLYVKTLYKRTNAIICRLSEMLHARIQNVLSEGVQLNSGNVFFFWGGGGWWGEEDPFSDWLVKSPKIQIPLNDVSLAGRW